MVNHGNQSPFLTYRKILLLEKYSAAVKLRRVVLSLFNGQGRPFPLSDISGFDDEHFSIFIELLNSYKRYGERDKVFMQLASEIIDDERKREAEQASKGGRG